MRTTAAQIYALAVPACTLLLSLGFATSWLNRRSGHFLLWATAAFGLFTLAITMQIMGWPGGVSFNAVASAVLFMVAAWAFVHSLAARHSVPVNNGIAAALTVAVVVGIYHFAYVDEDLMARIYILNFGVGMTLLLPGWRLLRVKAAHRIDRVMLGLFCVFGASFFVRTVLTAPWTRPLDLEDFGNSAFWLTLHISMLVFALLLGMLLLVAGTLDTVVALQAERNQDPLTQVLNRRGFEELAAQRLAVRGTGPWSVLMCDVDWFKSVNDTYGHSAGDEVLRQLGQVLRACVRAPDIVARLGGEEFVALLADTDRSAAVLVAQRIRAQLRQTHFDAMGSHARVTASFGVVQLHAGESLAAAIGRADVLLYLAKASGRDRVQSDGPDSGMSAPEAPRRQTV